MSKYNHLPKALHFDTIRGLSFQLMNFGRENSVHSAKEPFRVDALKSTMIGESEYLPGKLTARF